ncbi:WXG100 family type VII secretion target [Streptomyces carminius]|uniref:ESAT-6-like protein n=1 Tax=Streptomyces carminius TaxID=2665496 RepID=A0A2M8M4U5_9ACTN|nr:WXG100 family type VII secretion target [Streptomyces carminius]PJE99216.1 WXG100 family type VII secretion target [Streptomyces carminius]
MTIKITYATVHAAAEDIRGVATTLESQLNALEGKVKATVDTWDGEAKAAFYAKHRGWSDNVTGLRDTLIKISQGLEGAASGYKRTDNKAAQQFQF